MTASKRGQASLARRRIDDALEILRQSLAEHPATTPAVDAAPAKLDLLGLLSVFIERLPDSGLPRRTRTLAQAARDARNEVAHFTGTMTGALALHHLSAVRQLLVDLGAEAGVSALNPIYRAQVAELAAEPPTGEPPPGNPKRRPSPAAPAPPARKTPPTRPPADNPPALAARQVGPQADDIRRLVRDYYIRPAVLSDRTAAIVRAADVATLMDLHDRIPSIVNAIGGRKFESFANVRNDGRTGPKAGAATEFTYTILPAPPRPGSADRLAPAPSSHPSSGATHLPETSVHRKRSALDSPAADIAAERADPSASYAAGLPETPPVADVMVRQAKLGKLRYERTVEERRQTLSRLFHAIKSLGTPFTLVAVHRSMQESGERNPMTLATLVKYARVLFMGRAFRIAPEQDGIVFRERRMSLADSVQTVEDLILCYETPVAVRLLKAHQTPVAAEQLAGVLGLEADSVRDIRYCDGLLARARRVVAES